MGYLLQDRIEISVFIDDKEYPLGAINLLKSLHITTTFRGALPLLSMQIDDVQHILDRIGLQDGIPIRVAIKPNGKNTKTYNFRKFDHNRNQSGGSFVYTIYGYWDAPKYWLATSSEPIKGTSSDVLKEIASNCDLKFDGDATNDSQLWLPKNRPFRSWAKDIALNGWVDDDSCMVLGVDLDSTLRYKNVNNLPEPTKTVVAYQLSKDKYTAMEVEVNAASGFNNNTTGYQNMRYAQSTMADELHTQLKDLSFTPDSKSPLYNKELKDQIPRGAVRFGPIDVGNVHDNYEKASYQNTRYRNLFNMGLDLLIQQPTEFQLGERMIFSVQNEDTGQDASNSGNYTVSGHAIYVQGSTYAEKVSITRHGSNEKYVGG